MGSAQAFGSLPSSSFPCPEYPLFDESQIGWKLLSNSCLNRRVWSKAAQFYNFVGSARLEEILGLKTNFCPDELSRKKSLADKKGKRSSLPGDHVYSTFVSEHSKEMYLRTSNHSIKWCQKSTTSPDKNVVHRRLIKPHNLFCSPVFWRRPSFE